LIYQWFRKQFAMKPSILQWLQEEFAMKPLIFNSLGTVSKRNHFSMVRQRLRN
jgi:hypothetical protein